MTKKILRGLKKKIEQIYDPWLFGFYWWYYTNTRDWDPEADIYVGRWERRAMFVREEIALTLENMAGKGQKVLTAGITANRRGGSGSRNLRNSSQTCKHCLVEVVIDGVAYLCWESTSLAYLIGAVMIHRHVLLLNRYSICIIHHILSHPTVWDRCVDELCVWCVWCELPSWFSEWGRRVFCLCSECHSQ